jgi:diketogulonate reductase-like aldo/keto reductase
MRLLNRREFNGLCVARGVVKRIGRRASQRDRAFLVSKVQTNHVAGDGIVRACEGSLARLGTDHLDL